MVVRSLLSLIRVVFTFECSLFYSVLFVLKQILQKRNVEIVRLVVSNSFESRMMTFLQKKYGLTFGEEKSSSKQNAPENNADEDDKDDDDSEDSDDDLKDVKAEKVGKKKKVAAKVIDEVCKVVGGVTGNLNMEKAQVMTEEFDLLFGVSDRLAEAEEAAEEAAVAAAAAHVPQHNGMQDDSDGDDMFPDAAMSGADI